MFRRLARGRPEVRNKYSDVVTARGLYGLSAKVNQFFKNLVPAKTGTTVMSDYKAYCVVQCTAITEGLGLIEQAAFTSLSFTLL